MLRQTLAFFFIVLSVAAPATICSAADADLSRLEQTLRLEVLTKEETFPVQNHYGSITGANPTDLDLASYKRLFLQEFSLYPAALVAKTKLQKIILCRDLRFANQRRAAIPDYDHDVLYLDVAAAPYSNEYQRKVIHHEFFHIIDWQDDWSVYKDDAWSKFNAPGFVYSNGGRSQQDDPSMSLMDGSLSGFLTKYSLTGVEEDKAEVFANLMVNYRKVEERAEHDPVIKSKVKRIKELMASFCPEINESFWRAVSDRPPLN